MPDGWVVLKSGQPRRVRGSTYPRGVLSFVVDPVQEARLGEVSARLLQGRRSDGATRLAALSIAEVVDEFWPATDGWVTVSVEPGFIYVMTLLEHPQHGVAMSLIGTGSFSFDSSAKAGSVEAWDALDPMCRETWVRGVVHAQAPNRTAMVARMQAYYASVEFPLLAHVAVAGYLLTSPAFMDAATQTMVALADDRLAGHAASYQQHATLQGIPGRPLMLGASTARGAARWAAQQPLVVAAQQQARPLAVVTPPSAGDARAWANTITGTMGTPRR